MLRTQEDFFRFINERTVKPPEVLYKYVSMSAAWQILASGHVLWSSPLLYNDPFDSNWDVFWPLHTKEYIAKKRALFHSALMDRSSWPSDTADNKRALLERMCAEIDKYPSNLQSTAIGKFLDSLFERGDRDSSDKIKEVQYDLVRRMRIFCLSNERFSIPMWSHYADHHRGVLLGFVTDALEMNWHVPVERVEYVSDYPNMIDMDAWCHSHVFGVRDQGIVSNRQLALAKHKDWQSECEWRFVSVATKGTPGDKRLYKLPPASLAAIVFGCRAARDRAGELLDLARPYGRDLTVTALERDKSRFALIENARLETV